MLGFKVLKPTSLAGTWQSPSRVWPWTNGQTTSSYPPNEDNAAGIYVVFDLYNPELNDYPGVLCLIELSGAYVKGILGARGEHARIVDYCPAEFDTYLKYYVENVLPCEAAVAEFDAMLRKLLRKHQTMTPRNWAKYHIDKEAILRSRNQVKYPTFDHWGPDMKLRYEATMYFEGKGA